MDTTGSYFVRLTLEDYLKFSQRFQSSVNPNSSAKVSIATLGMGDNIFVIKANSIAMILIPPAGNTNAITIRTTVADNPLSIHKQNPFVLTMNPSIVDTSVIINAAAEIADATFVVI